MRLLTGLLLAVILGTGAACGGTSAPTPAAGGFGDLIAQLVLRGVTVHQHVSGDDGCDRVDLHANAARLRVSIAGDPEEHDVYLFRWRRQSDYESAASTFFMCVGDHRSQNPAGVIDVVEKSPWRAYGPVWSDALETAVSQAVDAAS